MVASFLDCIALRNFLSFGPNANPLTLRPLNVLIGANGTGKSNFVEAISVLRAVPKDLPLPIRRGGGVRDWLYRGTTTADEADLEFVFGEGHVAQGKHQPAVRYRLAFASQADTFVVRDERVENAELSPGYPQPFLYFGYQNGRPMLNVGGPNAS